jgi:tetratricopeptide (TPR) repeat protein
MSLINNMLKDLEQRPQTKSIETSTILADLKWGVTHELKENKRYYLIISTLVFILLLGFILLFSIHTRTRLHPLVSIPAASIKNTLSADARFENETFAKAQNPSAVLTGIALQVQQNSTALRLLLNQNTFYRVSKDITRNEFIIIFEKTHLLAALPKMNYLGSGIENIRAYIDEKGNLKLVLQLADDVDVKRLEFNEEGKAPELQLDLVFRNTTPTVSTTGKNPTIPVIIKKPVAENSAEQQYQQALGLCEDGQSKSAMQLLATILVTFPQYNQAREKLASLYLEAGDLPAANALVTTGLKHAPEYTPFTELKAHIQLREKNLQGAIQTLEIAAPPLVKNPEYHAFIAALYQRAGKYNLAANLYKQLITFQPTNGKWWLGLGVAMDSLGNHEQALEAYANADNIGGLNPELKAYVSSQLHTA